MGGRVLDLVEISSECASALNQAPKDSLKYEIQDGQEPTMESLSTCASTSTVTVPSDDSHDPKHSLSAH